MTIEEMNSRDRDVYRRQHIASLERWRAHWWAESYKLNNRLENETNEKIKGDLLIARDYAAARYTEASVEIGTIKSQIENNMWNDREPRQFGSMKGQITVSAEFDEPMELVTSVPGLYEAFDELKAEYDKVVSPPEVENLTDAEVEFAMKLYEKFPELYRLVTSQKA